MTVTCPICETRQELTATAGEAGVTQTSCTSCRANLVVPIHASPRAICGRRQGSVPAAQRVATPSDNDRQQRLGMAFSIGLCLLLYAVVGFGGYSSLQGWKSSEPYQMSEAFVRGNSELQRLVGPEMEFDWFPKGYVQANGPEGWAQYHLTVSGTSGTALVQVRLVRQHAQWEIVEAGYTDSNGAHQSLLSTEATDRPENPTRSVESEAHGPSAIPPNARLTEQHVEEVLQAVEKAFHAKDVDGLFQHMGEDLQVNISLQLPTETRTQTLTRAQYRIELLTGFLTTKSTTFHRDATAIVIAPDGQHARASFHMTERTILQNGYTVTLDGNEVVTFRLRNGKALTERIDASLQLRS
ncbi:MAG: cytochrome c oxidase assembly factor 1 family protein [Nitrospira sp.]|nr:cytochrome c oxidase assembly factor 1 family protein [Nitrospira sp.]